MALVRWPSGSASVFVISAFLFALLTTAARGAELRHGKPVADVIEDDFDDAEYGDDTHSRRSSNISNSSNSSNSSNISNDTNSSTPSPTTSPTTASPTTPTNSPTAAPTPSSVNINQVATMTFADVSTADHTYALYSAGAYDHDTATKTLYEQAYGLWIGTWSTSSGWASGCSCTSSASDTLRRTSTLYITFTASVHTNLAVNAQSKAESMTNAGLLSNIDTVYTSSNQAGTKPTSVLNVAYPSITDTPTSPTSASTPAPSCNSCTVYADSLVNGAAPLNHVGAAAALAIALSAYQLFY